MNIKFLSLVVAMGMALVGCDNTPKFGSTKTTTSATSSQSSTKTSTDEASNPQYPTYIATTDATNAPYEIRNDRGLVEGFDVDLIKAIAKEQHFNVTVLPASWDSIFNTLNSGETHIVIAPLTITPERLAQMDFSTPYIYPTRTAYLYPDTANKLGVTTYQDLPKGTISAKVSTSNITSLIDDFGEKNLKLMPADSQYLAFKNMVAKQADIAFGDTAVMNFHASSLKNEKFTTFEQPLKTPVEASYAVKKGNKQLADSISEGLRKTVKNGTYKTLAIKWFGEELGKKIADRTQSHMEGTPSTNATTSSTTATSKK